MNAVKSLIDPQGPGDGAAIFLLFNLTGDSLAVRSWCITVLHILKSFL